MFVNYVFAMLGMILGFILGRFSPRTWGSQQVSALSEAPGRSSILSKDDEASMVSNQKFFETWEETHEPEIAQYLINHLDHDQLSDIPEAERKQLVEMVYSIWTTTNDRQSESCLRNLYDNNGRHSIWTEGERARLIQIMMNMAQNGDLLALQALNNQHRK